jgi:divalent metal cation (Fe/Co/Zn/Cd) transporter
MQDLSRQVHRLQIVTIIWMSIEAVIALAFSWAARSPSLLAFGGDSLIELASAIVVLWRFRPSSNSALREQRAARIGGGLLFVLSGVVLLVSVLALLGVEEPKPTFVGMILLLGAALAMPWLARQKRRLAEATASTSLRADAAESAICGYMAWIALAGLLVNAIWHKPWADPVAALILIPIIVREGLEAVQAHPHQHSTEFDC